VRLEFEKTLTKRPDGVGLITDRFHIYVAITAVSTAEEKIAYAVENMAYSLGYRMTKKERVVPE